MKRQTAVVLGIIGGALTAASPASALVQVVGSTQAHDCFLAAKAAVNLDAGIAICDKALTEDVLNAHDRAGTYVNRGALKADKHLYNEAIDDYNVSIRGMPDLGDAYIDRGAALISLLRYDEALADINKGIALGISYPHVGYYNRAVAEELMGEARAAYYDYKHVLELEPDFALASERLKDFIVTTVPDKKPG